MVTVSVYQEVQRYKQRRDNKSATARKLGLARGTVRKLWPMNEHDFARFRNNASRRLQRFDDHRQEIITILENNYADGKDVYASSVYDVLEERHGALPGGQRTLRNYIRMLRDTGAVKRKPKKFSIWWELNRF